jgi:hypothetical protein
MARTPTVLHVDTLSIEGALFTAEWLAKVAASQAALQTDADYGVRAGFNVREEIGFAWRSAQSLWQQFDQARQQPGGDAWGISQRFATELLRQCFAFQLTQHSAPTVVAERNYPLQFSALDGHVPVVLSPHDEAKPLDTAQDRLGDNSGERVRRRSAFGLLQESLNAVPDALWGVATNGLQLRIARDNASLTRPAWVQVDLERLFTEERYADFSVLWLLLHATRFGSQGSASADCALEQWRNGCREQGTRARETLRGGVEAALLALGQGFVSHPANTALREALATGRLSPQDYLRELLRLVYRQIFLLTVEEREILHRTDAEPQAVALYADGYSLRRLRERAVRRSAHDRHGDLWQALKQVWLGLAVGESLLALPPLGGLFDSTQCPTLDSCKLENRHLLNALFHLAWLRPEANAPLTRVNWRDMGPEELGSIYESLLELVPMLSNEHRQFGFHTGAATRGNARKTTGSYYTHDSLVQEQLDSALEPVIAAILAAHPIGEGAVQALLDISVIDPACGSGHFLLAAARRIAGHLARVRAQMRDAQLGNSGQPTPEDYRHALRDVVTHCLYGVDMNAMALELARMALWLEAYTPDAPLGFIDHHFQLGNALLGVMDPKVILDGVPDDAYKALTGDNNALCLDLKRRNRTERTGLQRMREAATFSQSLQSMDLSATALPLQQLDELPDATLADIAAKRQAYDVLQQVASGDGLALALNLYCAAYLLPKHGTNEVDTEVPTTQDVMNALLGQSVTVPKKEAALQLAKRTPLLHWRLAFAQIFAKGGFTVVLANPPWERTKLQEEEYFAERAPAVATARNKAERDRAIQALALHQTGSPERQVYDTFIEAKQLAEASGTFCHGPRYPLTGVGDVNTYALFSETIRQIIAPLGRAGFIVPSGLATDNTTKAFFGDLVEKQSLVSFFEFENEGFFPGAGQGHMLRFALTTIVGTAIRVEATRFLFQGKRIDELKDEERTFNLSPSDIFNVNPNTGTCPIFRSRQDARINTSIYAKVPVLIREGNERQAASNPWKIQFLAMFHMSNDSHMFKTKQQLVAEGGVPVGNEFHKGLTRFLPLIEAKMINIYNHRHGDFNDAPAGERVHVLPRMPIARLKNPDYLTQPFYWIQKSEVDEQLAAKNWKRDWLIGWRDVTDARASSRTLKASVIPRAGVNDKFLLMLPDADSSKCAALIGNLSSLVCDYLARQKVGGLALKYFTMRQLPLLAPESYTDEDLKVIVPRVLEMTYTAQDLTPWARDLGFSGQPFIFDPERRAIVSAELDAIYARLYGLSQDDLRYILDPADVMGAGYPSETFKGLQDSEIRNLGEYRTRRLVLEAWDRMEQGEL